MKFVFTGEAEYEAMHKAEAWCREQGFSVGEFESDRSRGVMVGDQEVPRWTRLTQFAKDHLDGTMRGDMQRGPVEVWLSNEAAKHIKQLESWSTTRP